MTLLGAPGANCAFEFCAMIDGEKRGCVFFVTPGRRCEALELFSSSGANNLRGRGHYEADALPTRVQSSSPAVMHISY